MGSVIYAYRKGWNGNEGVYDPLKAALRAAGYPAIGGVTGGGGNVCCIVGSYKLDENERAPGAAEGTNITYDCDDNGNFLIVGRNEGAGGTHSEPVVLQKVQSRNLTGAKLLLFTERAPCRDCQTSIGNWARTFNCDIAVDFITCWTDTNKELDPDTYGIGEADVDKAREMVAKMRKSFS